jgi:acetyltransferase
MFQPKSIAVIGASNDEGKAGFHMLYALRKFPGALYPVNPKAKEIQGFKAYPNLKAIGTPVDLIALCIPAQFCLNAIQEAGEAGVGAALIAGGGFEETGAKGKALQDDILAACRQYGIRLLGPNTAGFVNPGIGVTASFNPLVSNFQAGSVAVVSQSGAMNLILGTVIQTQRLGVSIGVGTGNAPDVGVPEMLEYLADHEPTKAIAVYLEGVEDGRRLYEAVQKTTPKKPVAIFTVGKADIGAFAASHTGKLIGSFAIKKAALTQAGAVVASSSNDLIDAANILSKVRLSPAENPGVGILTGQAGPAMIMTDYLRTHGVSIPEMEAATIERIAAVLPIKTFIKNPVDTARPMHDSFLEVLSIMAEDPNLDVLAAYAMHEPICVEPVGLFRAIKGRTGKPAVFGTSGLPEDLAPTIRDLETMDLPAFVSPDRAAAAIWALVEDAKAAFRKQRATSAANGPGADVEAIVPSPDEAEAKNILKTIGIAVPKHAVCEDHPAAQSAFAELKKPCVVKVLSAAVRHKTEMGGVHLDIQTEDQLTTALKQIDTIDVPGTKQYLIEEMAPQGLEIIIGGKNDPSFGPVVMLGLGGTAAEAFGDVAMRIAPLTVHDAMDMIAELKTSALFDAWRGGPQYDKEAVADALVKIGALMTRHPEIKEMDLNPVRVYPKGVLALDALIVSQ